MRAGQPASVELSCADVGGAVALRDNERAIVGLFSVNGAAYESELRADLPMAQFTCRCGTVVQSIRVRLTASIHNQASLASFPQRLAVTPGTAHPRADMGSWPRFGWWFISGGAAADHHCAAGEQGGEPRARNARSPQLMQRVGYGLHVFSGGCPAISLARETPRFGAWSTPTYRRRPHQICRCRPQRALLKRLTPTPAMQPN